MSREVFPIQRGTPRRSTSNHPQTPKSQRSRHRADRRSCPKPCVKGSTEVSGRRVEGGGRTRTIHQGSHLTSCCALSYFIQLVSFVTFNSWIPWYCLFIPGDPTVTRDLFYHPISRSLFYFNLRALALARSRLSLL